MEFETLIEDYGYDGEGVGKRNEKICFIPYTIKGERIKYTITKETSSFCRGQMVEVLNRSPLRIEPKCPYFAKCGGCSYQHLPYKEELTIKTSLFKRQLEKIGYKGLNNVIASEKEYRYRNKLKLFVDEGGVGLKYRNSNKICYVDDCLLCEELITGAIVPIKNFILGNKLGKIIKNIILRQENEKCLINFILNCNREINYQGLYLLLGESYGIYQTYDNDCKHILGVKYLDKTEFGLTCQFGPQSFHQVNEEVCQKLYSLVLENVSGKVVNCYSGNGVLSGIITKKVNVIGIEIGDKEHEEAQLLRDRNRLKNLVNIKGDCSKILPNVDGDTLVVDPPRSGLDKRVCEIINAKKFDVMIYVSCNSATLVRDIARLKNLSIEKVYMLDMFARTGEYECLVILKNNNK